MLNSSIFTPGAHTINTTHYNNYTDLAMKIHNKASSIAMGYH